MKGRQAADLHGFCDVGHSTVIYTEQICSDGRAGGCAENDLRAGDRATGKEESYLPCANCKEVCTSEVACTFLRARHHASRSSEHDIDKQRLAHHVPSQGMIQFAGDLHVEPRCVSLIGSGCTGQVHPLEVEGSHCNITATFITPRTASQSQLPISAASRCLSQGNLCTSLPHLGHVPDSLLAAVHVANVALHDLNG